jgi:hypothetical protein
LKKERHGYYGTKEYRAWSSMVSRCRDINSEKYKEYGLKGIRVCERWLKFENFISDMGDSPSIKHSIDRYPDMSGNYEPSNCRWSTPSQQNLNRKLPSKIGLSGITKMKSGSYRVRIQINKKVKHLGTFKCPALAVCKYEEARTEALL